MTNGNDVTHDTKHTILCNKTKFTPYSVPPAHTPASITTSNQSERRFLIRALQGGVNPGTPAYVGYLCIILRRQKHTSRYICITPLLVKLAYFLPPKKLWWIHMYLFLARTKYVCACARRAAQIRTFSSVLSELFSSCLLCIPCPRSCSRESAA